MTSDLSCARLREVYSSHILCGCKFSAAADLMLLGSTTVDSKSYMYASTQ